MENVTIFAKCKKKEKTNKAIAFKNFQNH